MLFSFDHNSFELLTWVVLSLPLLSFGLNRLTHKRFRNRLASASCIMVLFTLVLSCLLFIEIQDGSIVLQYEWFQLGNSAIDFGFQIDRITALFLMVVAFVSFLVHLFSIVYMAKDDGFMRYFAFLGLFTFSMFGLLLANNLLVIFMFWELVGLCSYLLIGHWYEKPKAAAAAKKAFIVNRIGDLGLVVALGICWSNFNTFNLDILLSLDATQIDPLTLNYLGIALFTGAIAKSAQFPLMVWLPDAMEGPTPVSALIHAATMVAAGVYLLARVFVLLAPDVLFMISLFGGITAFMGAVAALTQYDIKKVLAFSTISQLGYMVMGIGVQAFEASLFHLFTHAIFKAGLFLGAGAIIHYLHQANNHAYDAQDMRKMGGLKEKLPITFYTYLVFSFALIGLPLFSGFLSKDAILLGILNMSIVSGGMYWLIAALAFISVALTAYYMGRQLLWVFFGSFRGKGEKRIKEDSKIFKLILSLLAVLSIGFMWSTNPIDPADSWVFQQLPDLGLKFTAYHGITSLVAITLALIGLGTAYLVYKSSHEGISTYSPQGILSNTSFNSWYLDHFYQKVVLVIFNHIGKGFKLIEHWVDRFVNMTGIATAVLAHIIGWMDRFFIDGFVNTSAYLVGRTGMLTRSLQGGKVQSYIILAVIGILIIIFLAL